MTAKLSTITSLVVTYRVENEAGRPNLQGIHLTIIIIPFKVIYFTLFTDTIRNLMAEEPPPPPSTDKMVSHMYSMSKKRFYCLRIS